MSSFSVFRASTRAFLRQTNRSSISKTTLRSFQSSAAKMGVHNITSKAEFEEAITNNSVVVLDAFATWCGPCKVIAPKVAAFSEHNDYKKAYFVKVDVDEVSDLAQELGIHAMPTFIIFKNGEKVNEVVGANPVALEAAIADATELKAE